MKIIADTNTFLAVTLYEPERDTIIRLTVGHDLVAPNILPFEIGNALSAMLKRHRLKLDLNLKTSYLFGMLRSKYLLICVVLIFARH